MANKTRGGNTGKPLGDDSNVVSLFGSHEGPVLAVDMRPEEIEESRKIMISVLERMVGQINTGEVDGIILIGMKAAGEFGAESFMGGVGVWGQVDRAVGIMEMVKSDLISEARKDTD